jgi:hypothetical protein
MFTPALTECYLIVTQLLPDINKLPVIIFLFDDKSAKAITLIIY